MVEKDCVDTEVWRPVVGHECDYSISSLGRVRRESAGRGATKGRVLSSFCNNKGYKRILLSVGNKRTVTRFIHHLVLEAFDRTRPEGMECNHKNGIRHDNRVNNLAWVTRSENGKHKFAVLGAKVSRGEDVKTSKLKECDVIRIRQMHHAGVPTAQIAEEYPVTQRYIADIIRGRSWRHAVGANNWSVPDVWCNTLNGRGKPQKYRAENGTSSVWSSSSQQIQDGDRCLL